MRVILNIFFMLFITCAAFAQSDLVVEGATPGLYLSHTVAAKETWYSIGRLYNISPKEVAPFNNTTLDKPLSIGETIKVPLVAANFSQNGDKAADEVFVPVYHVVQEKEWMYRISTNYNKVAPANIEKWNGITNDQLKPGLKLVVGYLKVKTAQSALASKGSATIKATTAVVVADTKPAASATTTTTSQSVAKTEDKKPETVVEKPAAMVTENKPVAVATTQTPVNVDFKGGYFKSQFESGNKNAQGSAAIFRSTSGWGDGKYYALMNNVPVGTIVKVSNASTNKVVYAKVLGNLADIKENTGLAIRISNAAAAELGAGENKFSAEITY